VTNAGYVDLHCHLLPAVDDGAKDLGESLEMARALAGAGFSDVAPSPHAWPELPDAAAIDGLRGSLQAELSRAGIALTLHRNAENRLDGEFFERLDRGTPRPLGHGRYVLVEAPFDSPLPSMLDLIFRIQLKGLTPLIAHPERCFEFQGKGDRAAEAVRAGALLQLELGAPLGRYGPKARKVCERLLDDDLYAVAASDLHGPAGAERWLPEAIAFLEKHGLHTALLRDNPALLLKGEPLPPGPEQRA
jgi:protein-tyrosine phosphatase